MTVCTGLIALAINLFAGILIFLLGLFWSVIPKSLRQRRLRRFWGKGVLGNDFAICFGTMLDSRIMQTPIPQFRFVKKFHSGRQIQLAGPFGNIVGESEFRASSYLINTLSTYRRDPVIILDDQTAYTKLDRTLVALGSSSSNEVTDLILREPSNTFLDFGQTGQNSYIVDKKGGQRLQGFQPPILKDLGMILKIPNTRFLGHFFFVCAGLGEWGTSGAAWYLAKKWNELNKEYRECFGIVVEVDVGSDESARRIFPSK
jgi:hypothetical protein